MFQDKILAQRFLGTVLVLVFFVAILLVFNENPGRAIFLLLSLIFFYVVGMRKGSFTFAGLITLFLVWPYNVTFQIPQGIVFNGAKYTLYDPYVLGIKVNYLVPTVSILDVFGILTAILGISEIGLRKFLKKYWLGISIFVVYLFINLLRFGELIVIFNLLRIGVFLCVSLVMWEKVVLSRELKFNDILKSTTIVIFVNVLIQTLISLLQIRFSHSLGLGFLGESIFKKGILGTSASELGGELVQRGYGTFPHPNVLAGFMLIGLVWGIFLMRKHYWLGFILLMFSGAVLVSTLSQTAMLLVAVVFILYPPPIWAKAELKVKRFLSWSFPTLPWMFIAYLIIKFRPDASFQERLYLLKASWEVFQDNWIWGVGFGRFIREMNVLTPLNANGISLLQPTHNVFALGFVEFGLFGGGILLLALSWIVVKAVCNSNEAYRSLSLTISISLLVWFNLDHYFITLPQGIFMTGFSIFLLCYLAKKTNY